VVGVGYGKVSEVDGGDSGGRGMDEAEGVGGVVRVGAGRRLLGPSKPRIIDMQSTRQGSTEMMDLVKQTVTNYRIGTDLSTSDFDGRTSSDIATHHSTFPTLPALSKLLRTFFP